MPGLTEKQLKGAFEMFDADGSGAIDNEELMLAMKGLGWDVSKEDLAGMLAGIDSDSNGLVEYSEFEKMIRAKESSMDSDAEIQRAFELFGNGALTTSDFVAVHKELGMEADVDKINAFIEAASNGGNQVTLAQWAAVMNEMKGK
eukprot:TRINITY_DN14620_c1_g3_i1.p1 TRINITY_DN14620_c1_g3~~TRINITY_DN14620_c1_g3_i1.p1  ORF type:complete len:145 (+),score=36.60 TRINITY_DN14620_c1_g3_i1:53-487(+)